MSILYSVVFEGGACRRLHVLDGLEEIDGKHYCRPFPDELKALLPAEMAMLRASPKPTERKNILLAARAFGHALEIRETPAPTL